MRTILYIFILAYSLSSCCLTSSVDCFCTPPKPYIVESTKDWIKPYETKVVTFVKADTTSISKKLKRSYYKGSSCVGGEECCANFPLYTLSYYFEDVYPPMYLLRVEAQENKVSFTSKRTVTYPQAYLPGLNVDSGLFSNNNQFSVIESDTIIDGKSMDKVLFISNDTTNKTLLFQKIEFVKGIGITSYTDPSAQVWVLN